MTSVVFSGISCKCHSVEKCQSLWTKFFLRNQSGHSCSLLTVLFTWQEMGLLEVKHGLLQIAESLDFLHNNAHLIHRAISPEVTTGLLNFRFLPSYCQAKWE